MSDAILGGFMLSARKLDPRNIYRGCDNRYFYKSEEIFMFYYY